MKPRIVIVGAGFAGAYCARGLDAAVRRGEIDVTVIDRKDYFVFHPLLIEAGTGSLQPRHVIVPIRPFAPAARFVMGDVLAIDLAARRVRFRIPESGAERDVPYDHLVLAPGSVTRMPPVPGLARHAFEMKELGDAIALRDRAVRLLEAADAADDSSERKRLLSFVVVGGNYTGVEVAGEFDVFLREGASHYPRVHESDIAITLVELGPRILPALDADLAGYATRKLRERGISVLLETTASAIDADGLTLRDGRRIPGHTVIWCAGIAPSPLLEPLDLPKDRGWVLCETDLRVAGRNDVWSIGDCAVNPDPSGAPYPPTAQHGVREGAHLARNLLAATRGRPTTPFVFKTQGSLAPLGCRTAVAKILGVKLSGFPAWFAWRTVYLMKMPGISRKARVAADWNARPALPA
ncbi:MAG: NAD(P)/FAD-dependent oxidoreductase [Acidobacteria bacterium]|nr:NAD(P)/FAD-dependent oxidoreductase [Acidobacteriota bacterium]